LIGRCFDEFWIDAIQPQFLNEFEGFKQRGKVNNELQLRCKDGRVLFIALDGIIQRDEAGKFVRTHCILHDITPYRMAEQALMHYAAIVASSEDAIISKDLSGTIMSWNGGAESLFGYRAAEMLGKPVATIVPEERREEEGMIMTGISEGRTFKHYETQRRRKDGQLVDVSVTVSPVRDRQGIIVGASKIARDITERKRAETELHRHREHLEELVNARTNALEALNGELEAFSFSVSHDLRTPLRAIDGFARLLAKKYADQLDEEGHRLIRVVCQNTERMSRLIDDILAFSRVGRGELHPAPVDMEALLMDVWTELEPQRQGRKIGLEFAPLLEH
jgi:PAS domain S-box-containing protein